jgi:hypothetical protein
MSDFKGRQNLCESPVATSKAATATEQHLYSIKIEVLYICEYFCCRFSKLLHFTRFVGSILERISPKLLTAKTGFTI